jgi:hypothetical protein
MASATFLRVKDLMLSGRWHLIPEVPNRLAIAQVTIAKGIGFSREFWE